MTPEQQAALKEATERARSLYAIGQGCEAIAFALTLEGYARGCVDMAIEAAKGGKDGGA